MIDLHCHLDLYPDPYAIAAECHRRKTYVLSVTTTPSAFTGTKRLAGTNRRIRTALGLHPELAVAHRHELALFEELLPGAPYVGEIGLDGSKPHRPTFDAQKEIFTDILRMCAAAGGRKLSVHSRGATGDVLEALSREPRAGTFILHWYLGSARQIAKAAEMGAWFSVGPAMLISARGRDALAAMPRDRVLPESDGPFGQINGRDAHPWNAWEIVPHLVDLWCEEKERVEIRLVENFKAFLA